MKFVTEALLAEGISGVDIVFRALPAAATASFSELEREVRRGVRRVTTPKER